MSKQKQPSYWFEAKRYGIGWTLPVSWEGWLAVLVFLVLLAVGIALIGRPGYRLAYIAGVSLIFVAVVAWKGEKPFGWRWRRK